MVLQPCSCPKQPFPCVVCHQLCQSGHTLLSLSHNYLVFVLLAPYSWRIRTKQNVMMCVRERTSSVQGIFCICALSSFTDCPNLEDEPFGTTRNAKIATQMGLEQKENEDLRPENLGPRLYCLFLIYPTLGSTLSLSFP